LHEDVLIERVYKTKKIKMKITVYLAAAANGMISNQRNVPDWLSEQYGQGFMTMSQQAKAVIMGKTTYNILAPDYLPLKDEGALVVLTHNTSAEPAQSNVVFTDKDPQAIVAMLERQGYSEAVIIGGTATVSEFMKAQLVNELILVVEPVLFGAGLPLMKGIDQEYKLSLLDVKKLNDHTVQLHYRLNA
jgi:dihydrofolate reductase